MAMIKELIRSEADGTISFGNYTLNEKSKLSDFEHKGDLYKVKTYKDITKLERNGMFVYESVPGTAVNNLYIDENSVSFSVEGKKDAQITLELAPETEYGVSFNGDLVGNMRTNLGGKLVLSAELTEGTALSVQIHRL